ncbi:MAG: class I SAM-dependent methyltransferase [Candidatus Moranbacteria bacterium]|nr:class I SAM-dependent methyltransferase [Candidatus Moranbacteria bacterium]
MEEIKNVSIEGGSLGAKFIDPEKVIESLEILPGMSVAEFGCGTGFFVFPVSKKVSESGRVYALDILKEKLEAIESQAKINGMSNIIVKRANLEAVGGSKLEENSIDWVFMVNMLFQNKQKDLIIAEAKRVLKPKGKMLIIEWNGNDSSFGPARDIKLSKEELLALGEDSQMAFIKDIEISDFHYGLIFAK